MAGTVVAIEAVLNRETRDGLSAAEQSYLHSSFMYTGGGLTLTAIAARAMFKSGVAVRVMTANPCTSKSTAGSFHVLMSIIRDGSWCQSRRKHWDDDGCNVHGT